MAIQMHRRGEWSHSRPTPPGARRLLEGRAQGARLDPGLRRTLEQRFGLDLAAVRMHTHSKAAALVTELGASAFASGTSVFFAADAYRPHTAAGLCLIEHEIAHVIQQARDGSAFPVDAGGVYLSRPGDRWEREADAVVRTPAGQPVAIASGLADVAAAAGRHPGTRLIIQRHDSFEHRALGDISTDDLGQITSQGARRTEILQREISLMWLWHQNPESVTEAQVHQLCPWINTLRLDASGLLVTYGELNALPDYIPSAPVADQIPKSMLLPILQYIRQESYIELNKLLNRPVNDPFQDAVYAPNQWLPGMLNKILESIKLDNLTFGLGIKGVDHYSALLGRNACHFAPYSWYRWQSSHLIARDLALRAHGASDPNERARLTHQAWVYVGYADHFLQDSFAAGHLVNKTLIMQWFIEWAATTWFTQIADWDIVKNVTTIIQPLIGGRHLYAPAYAGGSNDPQTAEDQATYQQRFKTARIADSPGIGVDTAYQNYLAFLSSLITQSASGAIHDYYNAHSLWVGSLAHPEAYEIWGDDTLLSGANGGAGTQCTSAAAQQSQQAIRELLGSGQTSITVKQIRNQFPTTVRSNGQMRSLEAWNDTQREFCAASIFPDLHDIIIRIANPRISNLSQDQDLTARWNANLATSGFNVANVLHMNGRLFAGSNGYVYEIDPQSGRVLHQLLVTGTIGVGNYETRLASNGQMLFAGVHGYVYAIALNDWSHVAWTTSLPGCGYEIVDVLLYANRLFAGSNGYAYEVDPGSGQVVQRLQLSSVGIGDYTMTLAAAGQVLFAGMHGYVYGINLSNWSAAAWNASLPSAGYTLVHVLVRGARLFAGSKGYVYEIDPANGRVIHALLVTGKFGIGDYTTRLAANDRLLLAGVHGFVYGIALNGGWSGSEWNTDLVGNRFTSVDVVAINNDQLLAGSYGNAYRIDPANGKLLRSTLLAWAVGVGDYTTRIVTDGQTLYAGAHGYAYGVSLMYVATMPTLGLSLWLEADTGVTLDGSAISQWSDQSGNGNNAFQAAAGNRPTLVSNALNGKPVVRFNGANQWLATANVVTTSQQYSMFVVCTLDLSKPIGPFYNGDSSTSGWGLYRRNLANYGLLYGGTDFLEFGATQGSGFQLLEATRDGSGTTFYVGGQQSGGTSSVAPGAPAGVATVGGVRSDESFHGDVAEVLVYNRALYPNERQQVEQYLRSKYAL